MAPASRIKRVFDYFYNFLVKNSLPHVVDCPNTFYNVDEANFELNPSIKRVLSRKGVETVYKVSSSRTKQNNTFCYCFEANGTLLKPQMILKEKCTRMEDLACASGTVNGDFLFTQTDS